MDYDFDYLNLPHLSSQNLFSYQASDSQKDKLTKAFSQGPSQISNSINDKTEEKTDEKNG